LPGEPALFLIGQIFIGHLVQGARTNHLKWAIDIVTSLVLGFWPLLILLLIAIATAEAEELTTAPETISSKQNKRDQNQTKTQQNQRS
jgi:hypothetical protein